LAAASVALLGGRRQRERPRPPAFREERANRGRA